MFSWKKDVFQSMLPNSSTEQMNKATRQPKEALYLPYYFSKHVLEDHDLNTAASESHKGTY